MPQRLALFSNVERKMQKKFSEAPDGRFREYIKTT
jgi:hypothetical protein